MVAKKGFKKKKKKNPYRSHVPNLLYGGWQPALVPFPLPVIVLMIVFVVIFVIVFVSIPFIPHPGAHFTPHQSLAPSVGFRRCRLEMGLFGCCCCFVSLVLFLFVLDANKEEPKETKKKPKRTTTKKKKKP